MVSQISWRSPARRKAVRSHYCLKSLHVAVFGWWLLLPQELVAHESDVLEAGASAEQVFALHARYLVAEALAHEHGEGVPRDPEYAATLYCEAARFGNTEAAFSLGWMYANGRGVERNDDYASALFQRAAQAGHDHAQRLLRFVVSDEPELPECLRRPLHLLALERFGLEQRLARLPAERREIALLVSELAPRYQISPDFALAIALTESALNPRAVSPKNAMGVMQLIPDTAARFNVRDIFDPEENIKGGLQYLRWLLAFFEGDVALAAAAYNAGERAVERYRGVPPFKETQGYVERILSMLDYREHPFDASVVRPSEVLREVRASR